MHLCHNAMKMDLTKRYNAMDLQDIVGVSMIKESREKRLKFDSRPQIVQKVTY